MTGPRGPRSSTDRHAPTRAGNETAGEPICILASLQTGLRYRVTTPPKCDKLCKLVEKIEGRLIVQSLQNLMVLEAVPGVLGRQAVRFPG